MKIQFLFYILISLHSINCLGQNDSLEINNGNSIYKNNTSKINIGLSFSNLLDLYEGEVIQGNGFTDNDLSGMNGSFTRFDKSYGLTLEFFVNHRNSLILDLNKGKMTAQNEIQFSQTNIEMGTISYRYYLNKKKENKDGLILLFVQPGIGISVFESNRYFVQDQGLFSQSAGFCISNSLGLGLELDLSHKIKLSLQSGLNFNYDDEFDGFDNGGIGDILLKTSLGIHFKL